MCDISSLILSLGELELSTLVSPSLDLSNLPSICLKALWPGRQCLLLVRRNLGVRERMPRRLLSVILRGWPTLSVNQVVKSAIVTLVGGHISSVSRILCVCGVSAIRRAPTCTVDSGPKSLPVCAVHTHYFTDVTFTFHKPSPS